jgi:RimJ/RimL family protein N-acetyltransferase
MLPAEAHVAAIDGFLAERLAERTRLRLATEADAAFLLGLRLDGSRNQNISATSSDLSAQVGWMRDYAGRHATGREAYFVIETDGVPQGSLRLYDYHPADDAYYWGSWIIRPGAPAAAAFRSLILAYDLAFGPLGFAKARFNVRQANVSVWKFHEKTGARMVHSDASDRLYEYDVHAYRMARAWLVKFAQIQDSL